MHNESMTTTKPLQTNMRSIKQWIKNNTKHRTKVDNSLSPRGLKLFYWRQTITY